MKKELKKLITNYLKWKRKCKVKGQQWQHRELGKNIKDC